MIIALRTDSPEAEVHIYNNGKTSRYSWPAGRQLARDLLAKIRQQLQEAEGGWPDVTGVVVFKGPGSFTGLRIGITVANTLAYGNNAPIVGTMGDAWLEDGIRRIKNNESDQIVLPHYGAEANITMPRR